MLTYGIVLLHENMRLHTAARTLSLLEHFNWELFDHPPYCPDITSSDYNLFSDNLPEERLVSQHFNSNEELMEGVKSWLNSQAAGVFDTDIQKFIP
jgi:hypothetical protein